MSRAFGYLVSVTLIYGATTPAFRNPPRDSFPFSDYPMFSHGRPTPMMDLMHALGVDSEGQQTPLPPMVSAQNREVLQSMKAIIRRVSAGEAEALCAEVAERVASSAEFPNIVKVEIAHSGYDAVAYFEQGPAPKWRRVFARCPVPRQGARDVRSEQPRVR